MKISCVTASYVAEPLDYPGKVDWGLAMEEMKRGPIVETLDAMLERLAPARLDGLEIFYPHVWPSRLTPSLASEIRRRLAAHDMVCCACAGPVVDPHEDPFGCEELFQTARLLDAFLIAGHMRVETTAGLSRLCQHYGVRLAYENGFEKDADEIMAVIEGADEWIGANFDSGNLAIQGGDPVQAIRDLGERIMHVHLKDVPGVGADDCVALGSGIVDVEGVLRELQALGYDGWLSIELENGDHDPTDEIIASAATVREILARG